MQNLNSANTTRQNQATNILVVDDSRVTQELLVALLAAQEYQVKIAGNGKRALEIIQKSPPPDLVLLDINLPDIDGYEVCRRIKESSLTSEVPVIFVTAESTQDAEAYGLQLGAADYITKPISPAITLLRVRNQILLKQNTRELGRAAHYDVLTEIPNRILFQDRLKLALASSHRSGRRIALLFIDIDNFKMLNDTLGHHMGDLLLQHVARRLEASVREGDTVARLGGDEFVIVLEDLSIQSEAAATQTELIANKILATLNEPYQLNTHHYHSTPSIGATICCGHELSIDDLLKQADIAMYQSKASGRNKLSFFDPQMQANISARVILHAELCRALENNEFVLYYQTQVYQQKTTGAEALIRWQHPNLGLVSPEYFMHVAEETGLILAIGEWVLKAACAQLKSWSKSPDTQALQLAVNISAHQFHQAGFVEQVLETIKYHGIDPEKLELELTESSVLNNINSSIIKMNKLRDIGVHFSMDDFGTGYSSLSNLKKLPFDQVKIDKSFIHDLSTNSDDAAIVHTIIAMTHNMGMKVIAEGVET
ncbi:MAG: EAL domain-containing protein, partial [Methyloprofundus sp.]|nr:EAL domain-containing protein [Methyloprofundus sp.]